FGYDPRTGRELWKVSLPGHSSSPRPVYGDGLVFAATGYGDTQFWALRPGGLGQAEAEVAWRMEGREAPQTPSPLFIGGLIYIVSNAGTVTCLEPATGEEVWSDRIGGSYMATPIHADGRLYFSNIQGDVYVLRAGRSFEVLSVNK